MYNLAGLFEDPKEARRKQIENEMSMEAADINSIAHTLAGVVTLDNTVTSGFSGYVPTETTGLIGNCAPTDPYPGWSGYQMWWPTYWPTCYEDKTAKAFKLVRVLMDRKVIKKLATIEDFVALVDEVVKVL